MGGDPVDDPADGVRPVEQRGRPAYDLDAVKTIRVDRRAVVTRLRAEIAGPDAVLHDQDPVTVEASDDRTTRAWSEATFCDSWFVLKSVSQRRRRVFNEIERVERFDRVERFESRFLPAGGSGDGELFMDGRQVECEVDGRLLAWPHDDRLARSGEVLALRDDFVGASAHIRNLECAVVLGQCYGRRAN